jgi:hypothetical protein
LHKEFTKFENKGSALKMTKSSGDADNRDKPGRAIKLSLHGTLMAPDNAVLKERKDRAQGAGLGT